MEETINIEALEKLDDKELCDHYYKQKGSIVPRFNGLARSFKEKPLRRHRKQTLKGYYSQMISFMDGFEAYQRVFFDRYVHQPPGEKKDNIDEYLRSSEIYFNRANTIINRINNEMTARDAKFAIYLGAIGILLSFVLFFLPEQKKRESPELRFYKQQNERLLKMLAPNGQKK
jgi:hypothetical protein